MREYWELFFTFAKIGAFTFGGGYSMLPLLTRELVEKKQWMTEARLTDYFAIGQCTPGIIAVNTATFVGYERKKYLGGLVATIGLVMPSCVIIGLIAAALDQIAHVAVVASALNGIRAAVCGLIFASVVRLFRSSVVDLLSGIIFALGATLTLLFQVSPAIMVLIAAAIGGIRTRWEGRCT